MPSGARGLRSRTHRFKIADRGTHRDEIKMVDGRPMVHVATQPSPRIDRKGKTSYIYWHKGSKHVYYNHGLQQAHYIPMGFDDAEMTKFYNVFCHAVGRAQVAACEWRERNNYTLV